MWEVWIWTGSIFTNILTLLAVWEQLEVWEVWIWTWYIFNGIVNLISSMGTFELIEVLMLKAYIFIYIMNLATRMRSVSSMDVEGIYFYWKKSIYLVVLEELEVWEAWIWTGCIFTNIVNLISSFRTIRSVWSLDMEGPHIHIYSKSY